MNDSKKFPDQIVEHLKWLVRNHRGASILIRAAQQNIIPVMTAISAYVAEKESWGSTDVTSYSVFDVAKQRLYLGNSILIDLHQKEMSHPDWSFVNVDCERYSTMFYDLELNVDDPYFNTIKRDYYNDVSN